MRETPFIGVIPVLNNAYRSWLFIIAGSGYTRKCLPAFVFILQFFLPFSILSANGFSPSLDGNLPGSTHIPSRYPLISAPDNYAIPLTTAVVTVRFANPQFDCETDEYCVDVEFQSDTEGQELFGMNVRFFYEESVLEFIDFRDFQGEYDEFGTTIVSTSGPTFGYNFFRLGVPGNSAADFVNGSIHLVNEGGDPIYISTTGWTKLFQVCFSIDDPSPDSLNFCPSLIWDLEFSPVNGGYLPGDDGVVITLATGNPGESIPADEQVEQFNWQYTGDGSSPPYGEPVETDCINISCLPALAIECPDDILVNCTESSLPDQTGYAIATNGCAEPVIISYTDSLGEGGCNVFPKIYRTWTATDPCDNTAECIQIITLSNLGSISGSVLNDSGDPVAGAEVLLMADLNANQAFDAGDTLVASTLSAAGTGGYTFLLLPACDYVLVETLPEHHLAFTDYDLTPDPDGNDQGDGPDLEIPVTLDPCENDNDNRFTNIVCPVIFPDIPFDTICEGGNLIFETEELNPGPVTYLWEFGSGSNPEIGIGSGPHDVQYAGTPENQSGGTFVYLTLSKPGCPDLTQPVSLVKVNPFPNATINASTNQGCYFTPRLFSPVAPELPGATYLWDFGEGAVPPTAIGYGPHSVYYDTAGTKTVSLFILPNEPGAQCPDSSEISFVISNCPANIVGNVKSIDNVPIPGVNFRLYEDADTNGIADNSTAIRSVFSTSNGNYSMAVLTPGHYVIKQVQPAGWYSFDDGDPTPDNDVVDNLDSLDNCIPVTLVPSELDAVNQFIEGGLPGTISGFVFDDFDTDESPGAIEGIANIQLKIIPDVNKDGVADSNTPLATTVTQGDGSFTFSQVAPGSYVLIEVQPDEYLSLKDFDASEDVDSVANANISNDTIPLTIENAELDEDNYFIDYPVCGTIVTSIADEGSGTLRGAIECAAENDTVFFHSALAGATISINSARIIIDKPVIIFSDANPRIQLTSQIAGFFDIVEGGAIEFVGLDVISGLSGNTGAAFNNNGVLKLNHVNVLRNPLLPPSQYLIYNSPSSELYLLGICELDMD